MAEGASSGRVIVVGSVNIDLVVSTGRLPRAGETVTGGDFGRHNGGKGGNQAVAASRLGAQTFFVGAVGDDPFGSDALDALRADGVDTGHVSRIDGEATGVALIVVDRTGENLIAVASGANARVSPADVATAIDKLQPAEGDVLLVGHEIPTPAAREALRLGRAAGARTIFNPAPPDGLDRATIGLADVLTPNRIELATLVRAEAQRTGRPRVVDDTIAAAGSLLADSAEGSGPGAVLVSLGQLGAVLVGRGFQPIDIGAARVAAVDTTGAGDTLNGALAAFLAGGASLEDSAIRAVRAATLSTTRRGAREGMPMIGELSASPQPSASGKPMRCAP
jgi:ribokinase